MGTPKKKIRLNRIVHECHHPAVGVFSFMETSTSVNVVISLSSSLFLGLSFQEWTISRSSPNLGVGTHPNSTRISGYCNLTRQQILMGSCCPMCPCVFGDFPASQVSFPKGSLVWTSYSYFKNPEVPIIWSMQRLCKRICPNRKRAVYGTVPPAQDAEFPISQYTFPSCI